MSLIPGTVKAAVLIWFGAFWASLTWKRGCCPDELPLGKRRPGDSRRPDRKC